MSEFLNFFIYLLYMFWVDFRLVCVCVCVCVFFGACLWVACVRAFEGCQKLLLAHLALVLLGRYLIGVEVRGWRLFWECHALRLLPNLGSTLLHTTSGNEMKKEKEKKVYI
jgi:hypothetical protein